MAKTGSIGVLGAGFTGLTAAYRLALQGRKVTVLEASETIGGLAAGFELDGYPLERAYHHLFTTDRAILSLYKELGLENDILWAKSKIYLYEGGAFHPFNTPTELLRYPHLSFAAKIRLGLSTLYLQRCGRQKAFDHVSAQDWLRKYCGREAYAAVWEPLLKGKFHEWIDQAPMAWMWARISQRANSRKGNSELLGYPMGGFAKLAQALREKIETCGGEILTHNPVHSIQKTGQGFTVAAQSETFAFDRLICTLPSNVLTQLLPEEYIDLPYFQQLAAIPYLGAVVVAFSSAQELLPGYWHNINAPGSPFIVALRHTYLTGTEAYGGRHIYYLGNYLKPDHPFFAQKEDDVLKIFWDFLQQIVPHFDRNLISSARAFRFARAQHVPLLPYNPPAYQTPLQGLYLANFSQIYPQDRSTNSAVEEGNKLILNFEF